MERISLFGLGGGSTLWNLLEYENRKDLWWSPLSALEPLWNVLG